LVLNVIRGLSDRFEAVSRHLRLSREFPTFLEVRSARILEEIAMNQRPTSSSTTLLAVGDKPTTGGSSVSSGRQPAKQQPDAGSKGSNPRNPNPAPAAV
jgi:hypothetical protein